MSGYDRYWEMKEGGPYDSGEEVFKCADCGAITHHDDGWNGEPDPSRCRDNCKGHSVSLGGGSKKYKENFDNIFPGAPGGGV